MLPVFAIVGRPNVGKSTLFNYLTKTRDALVHDMPGVTRDRQYGDGIFNTRRFIVVDTGGIDEPDNPDIAALMDQQVTQALSEADRIFFLVDAQSGPTATDQAIAQNLRRQYAGKTRLLVNKADRDDAHTVIAEFFQLGLGDPVAISATMGRGLPALLDAELSAFPVPEPVADSTDDSKGVTVAVVGRPNVGKSTLINRILGEERVIVFNMPGTTRDSIEIPFERRGKRYTLIDTAGVRRRARVTAAIEKFSIIKTLQAIEQAEVIVMLLNAKEGIVDQDLQLLNLIAKQGKALVIGFNQWDGLDDYEKQQFKQAVDKDLNFLDYARRYYVSALYGSGVGKLYYAIDEAHESITKPIPTSDLTRALAAAEKAHQPPLVKGRRVKLRYAHIGGRNPLLMVIHGKQVESLPGSYQRFLANFMRDFFKLNAVPVIVKLRNDDNPYTP